MSEAQLQAKIVKWLKDNGAYVIKTRPGPGTPVGCPDIIFLCGPNWGAIEVKASQRAPFRPGQKPTLNHMSGWSLYVYVVYPENWAEIRDHLAIHFF